MQIRFKKTNLDIYIQNKKYDYDINKDINIDSIRDSFNSTIGKLSQKHDSLEYWLMRISERNTLVNDLFLDICKIRVLESLNSENKNLQIYTNNISIYYYFKAKINISLIDRFKFEFKQKVMSFMPYLNLVRFIMVKTLFNIRHVDNDYKQDLNDCIIIQTWVSDDNFQPEGFHDSYYGSLAKYLKAHGRKVMTWPVFHNVVNEDIAIRYLRDNNFLIMEDYLSFGDYLKAIKDFFVKRYIRFGDINIDGDNFSTVFNVYQKREGLEHASLFYSFAKRLNECSNHNITFIHNHENMISEKSLILGVRKYLPNSKMIGYFHTTKPKNVLCLDYSSKCEYEISPKPDAIIFNSDAYRRYFQSKYKNMPMYNGVAFKNLHLKEEIQRGELTDKILVLFSGVMTEVSLMLGMLENLSTDKYHFLFRMHPMNTFDIKKRYSFNNYEIVNNSPFDAVLSRVSKVISNYSSAALESSLRGKMVGLLYNAHSLMLNPFDDTDIENYQPISTQKGLMDFLELRSASTKEQIFFNIEDKFYNTFLEVVSK